MISGNAFFVAEDAAALCQSPQPNGHDRDPFTSTLPAIDKADVARWCDVDPPEIIFTIEDLVPQGMVTLLTGQGGPAKRC